MLIMQPRYSVHLTRINIANIICRVQNGESPRQSSISHLPVTLIIVVCQLGLNKLVSISFIAQNKHKYKTKYKHLSELQKFKQTVVNKGTL